MTTISPTSIALPQKRKFWKEHKYNTFKQISTNKAIMFNYFFKNNDIFKLIQPADQTKVIQITKTYLEKSSNYFFGTMGLVIFTDKIIMKFLMPNFKILRFRPLIFIGKYLLIPTIGFAIGKKYLMNQQSDALFQIHQKYDFGFQEFMKANRIFDRALQVDRLEQLLQKRQKFDWTGVPQLPSQN